MDYILMGERVRRIRKSMKLTQDEFAANIGITASFLGHIERGSRVASIDTLEKICKYANCSANYLLGLSENKSTVMLPDNLTEDQQKIALNIMRAVVDALNT